MLHRFDSRAVLGAGLVLLMLAGAPGAGVARAAATPHGLAVAKKDRLRACATKAEAAGLHGKRRKKARAECLANR